MDTEQNTEAAEVEVAETEEIEGAETPTSPGDPLETISDPAELLKKAKGFRAAYQRLKDKVTKKAVEPAPVVEKPYVTKEDFYKANEKDAKETLATSESATDKEISENFDAIFSYYKDRSGRDTVKGILKDLRAAHAAWRFENPKKDTAADDAVRDLTGAPIQKGGAAPTPTKVEEGTNRFKTPRGPDEWYPKKKEE